MKLFVMTLVAFHCLSSHAQTNQLNQKIGHANWDYIFSQLPEYKKIERDLKTFETQLQTQLRIKDQELEAKYNAYQTLAVDT
jgi:outer membrane protein